MRLAALSLGIAAVLLCHELLGTTASGQDGLFMNSEATAPIPAGLPALRGRSFVPLHSTVIAGGGATRLNFSGSLSIHNTSAKHVLIIDAIEYRDASGRLVENYAPEKSDCVPSPLFRCRSRRRTPVAESGRVSLWIGRHSIRQTSRQLKPS